MKWPKIVRTITVLSAMTVCFAVAVQAYKPERQRDMCSYDYTQPRLNNARNNFGMADYDCAFYELKDLLRGFGLPDHERAEANFLLAAVYYNSLNDRAKPTDTIRAEVISAAHDGYVADTSYTGDIYIQSQQFRRWLGQARRQVVDSLAQQSLSRKPPADKGPWYKSKKVWGGAALAVGVGLYFLLKNGDDGNPDETLPYFPDPPGGK